jgi:ABC-type glycerol-3-phosphate transport system permease component
MTEPRRTTSALKHAILIGVAIVMMAPFVWMVLASFKTLGDIESGSAIPSKWQPQNYADVFKDPDVSSKVNFSRYYFNSLFVAAWVTFLTCLTSAMAAFAFLALEMAPGAIPSSRSTSRR